LTAARPPTWAQNMEFEDELWISAGKMVILKCPAVGDPVPTIQWWKDDEPLTHRAIGKVITCDSF